MNRNVTLLAVSFMATAQVAPLASQTTTTTYPATRKSDQVDTYHGVTVADPYRWLEDTDSPETRRWIEAQNALTSSYLSAIPQRESIRARLNKVWNYERYGVPIKAGNRYFYSMNTGLQNQAVLYVQDGLNGKARVLLDPNTLSSDGTVALSYIKPSRDGRYLAYAVSAGGSDWREIRVRDAVTGKDLADNLKWIKFSGVSWTRDGTGFVYSRYDAPAANSLLSVVKNQKLYYHKVGTPQSDDELIYDRKDQPDWNFQGEITDDGQFLIISISQSTDPRNRLYFMDLANPKKPNFNVPVVKLLDDYDAEYDFLGNSGNTFYVRTTYNAPRGRVVAINNNYSRPDRWTIMVPESGDALTSAKIVGNNLVASYLHNAYSVVRFYVQWTAEERKQQRAREDSVRADSVKKDTLKHGDEGEGRRGRGRGPGGFRDYRIPPLKLRAELKLPGLGTVSGITGEWDDEEMFYAFSSYLYPTTIYRYDIKTSKSELFKAPKVDFDPSAYETKQVFYKSKDSTIVPMFITMKKGTALDGNNPTMLYGYGGFNISLTPSFTPENIVWLELGGIYAVANLRGGGEYGQDWYNGGRLAKKQNVFDDFIAAAEYLIKEKYTSTPKLAISGRSNGGLLIGAVLNQRPDLFGAAIPGVGVMDMLRFNKFTIGWAWVSDYGSPDKPDDFKTLYAYSPLHNIKPGVKYPATLILTADHDDRVVPGHSFKYAATLQAAQAGPAPILIRIDTQAGHGAGTPLSKSIDEATDRFAFLIKTLGISAQ